MTHLDDDAMALIRKRVVDVAGFLGVTVQVVFNGQRFQRLKNFRDYVLCYISSASIDREERLPKFCDISNKLQFEYCYVRKSKLVPIAFLIIELFFLSGSARGLMISWRCV